MASGDEPSNPFKSPRKSTASPKTRSGKAPRRSTKSRGSSGPPAPPGANKKQSPPIAPSGTQTSSKEADTSTPAQARKSVGLRKQDARAKIDAETKTNQKARELIEASRTKVVDEQQSKQEARQGAKAEPHNPFKKTQAKRPGPAPRRAGRPGKRNRPQGPTKRVKKLHRGKYMEFKYDVRRILEDEDVADEHRSNVLGQTWAKGERQGVSQAKEYLDEKVAEGIISEACSSKIMKLIDTLTTRR